MLNYCETKSILDSSSQKTNNEYSTEYLNYLMIKICNGIPPHIISHTSISPSKESEKIKWVYEPFVPEGRKDLIQLYHWKKLNGIHKPNFLQDVPFNFKPEPFTNDQYKSLIKPLDSNWSKKETILLWNLVEEFDLRFPVICDRFQKMYQKSTEDIKNRYFSVTKALLTEKFGPNSQEVTNLNFHFEKEVRRKNNIEKLLLRSAEEVKYERQVIEEIKNVDKIIIKEEREKKNLEKLINNDLFKNTNKDFFFDNEFIAKELPSVQNLETSGVYLISQRMKTNFEISSNLLKKLDLCLQEMAIPQNLVNSKENVILFEQLKKEILIMFALEKHLEKKRKDKENLETRISQLKNMSFNRRNAPHTHPIVPQMNPINPQVFTPKTKNFNKNSKKPGLEDNTKDEHSNNSEKETANHPMNGAKPVSDTASKPEMKEPKEESKKENESESKKDGQKKEKEKKKVGGKRKQKEPPNDNNNQSPPKKKK